MPYAKPQKSLQGDPCAINLYSLRRAAGPDAAVSVILKLESEQGAGPITSWLSEVMADPQGGNAILGALFCSGASRAEIEAARGNPEIARELLLKHIDAEQRDPVLVAKVGQVLLKVDSLPSVKHPIFDSIPSSNWNGTWAAAQRRLSLVRPTVEQGTRHSVAEDLLERLPASWDVSESGFRDALTRYLSKHPEMPRASGDYALDRIEGYVGDVYSYYVLVKVSKEDVYLYLDSETGTLKDLRDLHGRRGESVIFKGLEGHGYLVTNGYDSEVGGWDNDVHEIRL